MVRILEPQRDLSVRLGDVVAIQYEQALSVGVHLYAVDQEGREFLLTDDCYGRDRQDHGITTERWDLRFYASDQDEFWTWNVVEWGDYFCDVLYSYPSRLLGPGSYRIVARTSPLSVGGQAESYASGRINLVEDQPPAPQYERRLVGEVAAVDSRPDGSFVLAGDLDEALIVSFDASGNISWSTSVDDSNGSVTVVDVATVLAGGCVLLGTYEGTILLGPGEGRETVLERTTSALGNFVARYGGDGALDWARSGDQLQIQPINAIASAEDGSSIVSSYTSMHGLGPDGQLLWTTAAPFYTFHSTTHELITLADGSFLFTGLADPFGYIGATTAPVFWRFFGDGTLDRWGTGGGRAAASFPDGSWALSGLIVGGARSPFAVGRFSTRGELIWGAWSVTQHLAAFPDGSVVAASDGGKVVRIGADGRRMWTIAGAQDAGVVRGIVSVPDGSFLLVVYYESSMGGGPESFVRWYGH